MPSSNVSRPNWKVSQAFVDHLLALLDHWGDNGNTVVVIEHHQAVMAHADHLIDLGPGPDTTEDVSSSRAARHNWWSRGRR